MHALVTGGAGFIGSHLTERLLRDGHVVTVLVKPGENTNNINSLDVRKVSCDILDKQGVLEACAGIDIIYHLAARTDLEGTSLTDYDVNIRGTKNILAAAEMHGVKRLLFYSTMLAVPLTGELRPIDEKFDAAPTTVYGQSKREGENIIARGQVPWTVIRPTLVFGPRERSTMWAFLRAIKNRRFMLIGRDVSQSFVYVKNLVEATYLASLSPAAVGQVFFVSDERPYTLAEFAAAAADSLGVVLRPVRLPKVVAILVAHVLGAAKSSLGIEVPLTPSRVRTMTTHYVYSIDKATELLGYRPRHDLRTSIAETTSWYRAHQLL